MNIIIFGPNGSGKGTQACFLEKQIGLVHIETGSMFRNHLAQHTELGEKARAYINKGELVPDSVTIPMILETLEKIPHGKGWLLDGFPRNMVQAEALLEALAENNINVDYIIEITLDRATAKKRLLGRRTCSLDVSHSNNIAISAIAPYIENKCRICSAELTARSDDLDENAINKRHEIYYDTQKGTLAGLQYCKKVVQADTIFSTQYITIDGSKNIQEVQKELLTKLKNPNGTL